MDIQIGEDHIGAQSQIRDSHDIRKLLQMKDLVKKFLKCKIGDGSIALFWYDNWSGLGDLLCYIGEEGPRLLRIPLNGRVCDAISNGSWLLPGARSQRIQDLYVKLLDLQVPDQNAGADEYEWMAAENVYSQHFSAPKTWKLMREVFSKVEWAHMVWFKQATPRRKNLTTTCFFDAPSVQRSGKCWPSRFGNNLPTTYQVVGLG
ncbi:PREDICTED: uncharacterized protein LOC104803479 [Tarenaya hassleriana]|uniref:uncharacterized protein LOC104803479 n=1 Tax=Tarenaya hassleriana TaxID=28532 RepID=UPI00053C3CFD|nr:PREDICTED: uncharacterized protein LOC104803479 [Tarenaya hassleriana]